MERIYRFIKIYTRGQELAILSQEDLIQEALQTTNHRLRDGLI